MATGGTTNNMPIVGSLGALRPTFDAIQRWLKARLDVHVLAGSNILTGFQGQMRAYAVPCKNVSPTYQGDNSRGQWLMQWGQATVTTDAGGYGAVTFPVAFPSATTMVVASIQMPTSAESVHNIHAQSASGFTFRKGTATAVSVTVNYIAVGV